VLIDVPDQRDELATLWNMDDAADGNRLNDTATIGGSNCDMTDLNSSVGASATNIEGTGSADFEETDTDVLELALGTCTTVDVGGSVSFGTMYNRESATGSDNFMDHENGFNGGLLKWDTSGVLQAVIADGTDRVICSGEETTSLTDATWYYLAMSHNASAEEISVFVNGGDDRTSSGPCTQQAMTAPSTANFIVSHGGGSDLDGLMDYLWIYLDWLSEAEHCYVCSCGWEGSEFGQCTGFAGGAFVGVGQNAAQCNSCDLSSLDPSNPIP
jgi:hypothetical protein